LVDEEEQILLIKVKFLPDDLLIKAKKDGFADKYLAKLLNIPEKEIRIRRRISLDLKKHGSLFL
jgi:carbamoyl-phosphate synthase large subunit